MADKGLTLSMNVLPNVSPRAVRKSAPLLPEGTVKCILAPLQIHRRRQLI